MRCTIKPMTLADYDEVLRLWQNTEGVGLNESDTRTDGANDWTSAWPKKIWARREPSEAVNIIR